MPSTARGRGGGRFRPGASRIRVRRPPRHHRTPSPQPGETPRPDRPPPETAGRARPGTTRPDHRRRGGPPSQADHRLRQTAVSGRPPSQAQSSERLRKGRGSRRRRAGRSRPPADRRPPSDRRPPAALTHPPTSVPRPRPRPPPRPGPRSAPATLRSRMSAEPDPPPISAADRAPPPCAPSTTPHPNPTPTRRPAPAVSVIDPSRSSSVTRARIGGTASRPNRTCMRMGSSHGRQGAEE